MYENISWVYNISVVFFNDTATTEIYTLSLHDALPIFTGAVPDAELATYYRMASVYISMSEHEGFCVPLLEAMAADRKSTRLNSSHANISYAVFCLKKKNKYYNIHD